MLKSLRAFLGFAILAFLLLSANPMAQASPSTCERLPEAVLIYLKSLDPNLKVREDCLAVLSQKRSYLPVLPQGHDNPEEPTKVLAQYPLKSNSPDWVQFDNGFYLLRLIETENGKITFSRTETIPTALKTGLLPQNFLIPAGFSIPAELRIIVGDLPYETPLAQAKATSETPKTPKTLSPLDKVSEGLSASNTILDPILFTASLKDSRFTAWDAISWKAKWSLPLTCLATTSSTTQSGEYLYVNCLNSSKINVIDIKSQQRLSELELSDVTQQLIQHAYFPIVIATHRYAAKITFLDSPHHLIKSVLNLPFALQEVAMHPRLPLAYGVDTVGNRILEIDVQQMKILRQFDLKVPSHKIHAVWIDENRGRFGTFWMVSRDTQDVYAIDLFTGTKIHTLKLASPLSHVAFVKNEKDVLTPLFVSQGESNTTQTMFWDNLTPKLGDAHAIEGADKERYWMSFQAATHPNELLGVDAIGENVYLFKWDPTTQVLRVDRSVIANMKSSVLTLVESPTAETLALIQKKTDALAPNETETEILTSLRSQPSRQNGFSRLGGVLRFAPRDL
ncbi:MAG: YncE family protein [Vampirovibrionales bacterium]